MTDLTKIKTPVGLLDDATREALKAHGGPYECWGGPEHGWEPAKLKTHCWAEVYRVKPQPPKPRDEVADLKAEIERLNEELSDVCAVAENFTDLETCNGGRTVNAGGGGYVCMVCGVDRSAPHSCGKPRVREVLA